MNALLDGPGLRSAFASAADHLREQAKRVDSINVYPVPDGDTGSNMSATLREAVATANELPVDPSVSDVLAALAKGALYGARGNSGVILSQALRGLAAGAGDAASFDALAFAAGMDSAATMAYAAVAKPAEGTMLTVLRSAANAAVSMSATLPNAGTGQPCAALLASATKSAEEAEAATMEQLPALKEAGVPDAGGEGICVILRGLLAAITGETAREVHPAHRPIALQSGHGDGFGFCTEFLLERAATPIDLAGLRAAVGEPPSTSLVLVGDESLARVHVHTPEPDALIAHAARFGAVSRTKVEDMSAQNTKFEGTGSGAGAKVALLALSHGSGFDEVFRSLGATVANLGSEMKPTAGEIAAAADALRTPDVIVLPNHKNVTLAAEQARSLAAATITVVPTESLPQGIAAALAFDPDERTAGLAVEMANASSRVQTVEVTMAAADRTADGIAVRGGQAIALLDGRLVFAGSSLAEALLEGLRAGSESASLITIYHGEGVSEDEAAHGADLVKQAFPSAEIEVLPGGQPLYPFIASLEK